MKKIEREKGGIQQRISHYEFTKIKKTTFLLLITFGIILFPNPFLINPFIQIENDNQNIEEINFSNLNEESFDKFTIYSKKIDTPSYFWKSINALVYLLLIRDLSLNLILH